MLAWAAVLVIGVQIYVANATRLYRVTMVLAPASQAGSGSRLGAIANQFQGLAAVAGIDLKGEGNTAIGLATLRGSGFTLDFIHELNLAPVIFPERWDKKTNQWRSPAPTDIEVLKVFNDSIRQVIDDKRTNLISLQIRWRDPALAASWANTMVARLNERMRLQAKNEAERSLSYLKEEMKDTDPVETRQAISRLIEAQMREVMLANVRKDYQYVVVDPPILPQERDFVWPRRMLLSAVALVLAAVTSFLFAVGWENFPRMRATS